MRALRRLFSRLISWTARDQYEERLKNEIEAHLEFQTAENIDAGLDPSEARRQAALKFGALEAVREHYRDERGFPFLDGWLRDIRFAIRRLAMAPAFSATVILILALGIGATTSVFTLVYAVLLKPLAVANPAELLRLGKSAQYCFYGGYTQSPEFSLVSYQLYQHLKDHTKGFSELAAFSASGESVGVRRKGRSEPAYSGFAEFVSGNYFQMFGVRGYAGRALTPSDDRFNTPPVAVISYRLWQQRYGSDPSVVGSVFDLNGKAHTIVGVTPPGFYGDSLRTTPPDFFLPLSAQGYGADSVLSQPDTSWLDLIGRVRPGYQAGSIEAQMRVELKQWLRSHWNDMSANARLLLPRQTLNLEPGGAGITQMRDEYQHWLHILSMVSAFVLLIVCANIANLMLVRGIGRRRQTALSLALGARPWELVREALTESVLLSTLGGVAGLAVAFAATSLILHFVFPRLGNMGNVPIEASPSPAILLFAFTISLLTGIGFGVAPAFITTRVDAMEALRGSNRSTVRANSTPRKTLVILQAALALVLLSASGLLTSALWKLESQDFGFIQERRIIVDFDPRLAAYEPPQLSSLYRRIEDAFSRIPGVSSVALCTYSPLAGNNWGADVWIDGHSAPGPNDDAGATVDRVRPGYFAAIGNPIVRGRPITGQDTAASQHVAVINQAFARKYFPNTDPLDKYFGRAANGGPRRYRIVGVAKDARYLDFDLNKAPGALFFLPEAQHDYAQSGSAELDPGAHYMENIVVVLKPGATVPFTDLRRTLASVDPDLPVKSTQTLARQVAGVFRQQRLIAHLTSFFGCLSLVLTSIGLYGVTAYNVGRRTIEIGVRMALGANRRDVLRLVLSGAFALIVTGLLIGLPLTFAVGRFLGSQLYGVNPSNSTVIAIAVSSLSVCGLTASLIPALRASLFSPCEALRAE